MSAPKTVQFNADEQMVSSDFNNSQIFAGQELSDVLARIFAVGQGATATAGVLAGLGGAVGGVLAGLEPASITGSGSSVGLTVNPGLGFLVTSSPPGGLAGTSGYQWIKLSAQQVVTLPAQTASAQIVLIQAAPSTSSPVNQSRNVWNPSSQTVQAASVTKEVDPSITLSVKPLNAPAIPSPDAGYIPIAYVYLPATGTSPTTANVIDVRRLLGANNFRSGIVGGLGLTWNGSSNGLKLGGGWGFVNGLPIRLYNDASWTGFTLSNLIVDTGALTANAVYYCYAAPNTVTQPLAPISDQTYQTGTVNGVVLGGNYTGVSLVLSRTAPSRDGRAPSTGITVNTHLAINGGANIGVTITDAIFVGSVCTDGSGNIMPFARSGDRVILAPANAPVTGSFLNFDPGAGYADPTQSASQFVWNSGTSYPSYQNVTFGGVAGRQLPLPATASAMIADIFVSYYQPAAAGNAATVSVIDGALPIPSGTTKNVTGQAIVGATGTTGTQVACTRTDAVLTSAGKLYLEVDYSPGFASGGSVAATVVFRGYVESVPHLTF